MSNSAARNDLFSASALPIWMRFRISRLGSGGFGMSVTIRAISEEKASGTCSFRIADVSKYLQPYFWATATASSARTSASPSALLPTSTRGRSGLLPSTASSHCVTRSNVVRRVRSKTRSRPAAWEAYRAAVSRYRGAPGTSHIRIWYRAPRDSYVCTLTWTPWSAPVGVVSALSGPSGSVQATSVLFPTCLSPSTTKLKLKW
mmetsp:Transcript_5825/g.15155  ORF Transcript_5825/g.15155 Transcript_5825/m.15155 type:complete len:203 (+) Transcript_5825:285-893(+)